MAHGTHGGGGHGLLGLGWVIPGFRLGLLFFVLIALCGG
jgi:hypothetical protein